MISDDIAGIAVLIEEQAERGVLQCYAPAICRELREIADRVKSIEMQVVPPLARIVVPLHASNNVIPMRIRRMR